jgi:tetratricopeptide (TPR) repeat protein
MQRKQRVTALAACALIAAGCAHSEFKVGANERQTWRPVARSEIANAKDAETPKVLPETHFAAARLFESQGLFEKAITQYRRAIAFNHSYVDAYHRLGLLLSITGRHEGALASFERALALKPDSPVLRNNFGFELLMAKRWTEAETQLSRAIELKPDFARAYVNLGMAQSKLGRFDEALATFRSVLPETDAYYNLGLMYRGQKRYEDATEAFRYVLSRDPDFTAAQNQLEQIASMTDTGGNQPGSVGHSMDTDPADARWQTAKLASEVPTARRTTMMSTVSASTADTGHDDATTDLVSEAEMGEWATETTTESGAPVTWSPADMTAPEEVWFEEEPCPDDEVWTDEDLFEEPDESQPITSTYEIGSEGEKPASQIKLEKRVALRKAPAQPGPVCLATDEPVSYLDKMVMSAMEPGARPVYPAEATASWQSGAAACAPDPMAVLRELNEQLNVLRNETECLDEADADAAEAVALVRLYQARTEAMLTRNFDVGPGPLFPTERVGPAGPPVELAMARMPAAQPEPGRKPTKTTARLVVDREVVPLNSTSDGDQTRIRKWKRVEAGQ